MFNVLEKRIEGCGVSSCWALFTQSFVHDPGLDDISYQLKWSYWKRWAFHWFAISLAKQLSMVSRIIFGSVMRMWVVMLYRTESSTLRWRPSKPITEPRQYLMKDFFARTASFPITTQRISLNLMVMSGYLQGESMTQNESDQSKVVFYFYIRPS